MGPGEPTCCQLAPPSSDASSTLVAVSGAFTPQAACLCGGRGCAVNEPALRRGCSQLDVYDRSWRPGIRRRVLQAPLQNIGTHFSYNTSSRPDGSARIDGDAMKRAGWSSCVR